MASYGMHDAKTHLSQLVERALAGEEIVVTRRGEPAVRLSPVEHPRDRDALLGLMAGEIELAADFDELPDDIAEALGAR
jgi:prevent-host-death family protein